MLIRVTGAAAGIREYLEKGHKQGREFSRDMLDERVVLSGDLEVTDAIIKNITTNSDRYLHVTASFKEDDVSLETLMEVLQKIQKFAFSAYEDNEYNMYAEAHFPKIKSYVDRKTGQIIERKPHIHIVIPKINLLSGTHLNPFGRYEHNEEFVEAIQEITNHELGLASPKDNRRVEITDTSEMIARYKGDLFAVQGRAVKARLLNAVLDRGITSYEGFEALARSLGEVRERNAGRADRYLNLKVANEAKGVNLKDYVFSRVFLELSDEEKHTRLAAEIVRKYESASAARLAPAELQRTLRDWHERRALEIKYLNSGNKRQYAAYRAADAGTRRAMLATMRDGFYAKHRPKDTNHDRPDAGASLERIDDNFRAAGRQLRAAERHIKQIRRADAADGQRKLSDRRDRALVAAAIAQLAIHQGPAADDRPTRRESDTVAGQLSRDYREQAKQFRNDDVEQYKQIKKALAAHRLLAHLSHTHGVIPEKYLVTKAKDGTDRIRAGDRNLNVSDFLTKEMHLSWHEAVPILREAYEQQLREATPKRRQALQKDLWQAFGEWDRARAVTRHQRWAEQRAGEPARRQAIRDGYRHKKQKLDIERATAEPSRRAEIRAELSVLRMNKVQQEMALRQAIANEREALLAEKRAATEDRYKVYLTEQAQAGNERALAELRKRQARTPERPGNEVGGLHVQRAPIGDREPLHRHERLVHFVEASGQVSYYRDAERVLVDCQKAVSVLRHDDDTIEMGLRLAIAKWGSGAITVSGTEEFKRRVAELAAEKSITVLFRDETMNQISAERQSQLAQSRIRQSQDLAGSRAVNADDRDIPERLERSHKPLGTRYRL